MQILQKKGASTRMTLFEVQIKAIQTADFIVILLKQVTFFILFIFVPLLAASSFILTDRELLLGNK